VAGPATPLSTAEGRQAFLSNRHVLEAIATYGYMHGDVVHNAHSIPDVRPWHYRINE
jgi:hypothetical protein